MNYFKGIILSSLLWSGLALAVPDDDITALLQAQQQAWNQGDIDGYMAGYWHDPSLSFVSGGKLVYGWENMRDAYHQHYPDVQAMGKLSLKIDNIHMLSNYAALVTGSWHLEKVQTAPSGVFTLLLEKHDDAWRIVHDHSSH